MRDRRTSWSVILGLIGVVAPALAISAHPADTNDDQTISLEEMIAYGGALDDGAPMPEEFIRQAVYLWRNGEAYREIEGVPAPFGWVPNPSGHSFAGLAELDPEPMDVVEIFGLPIDPDNVTASFSVTGEEGAFSARLIPTDAGMPALLIPFNPHDPTGGGELHFTFTGDGQTWQAGPIRLQPLPAAPGRIQTSRGAVVDWIEEYAALVDADLDSWLNEPIDEVPAGILPLVALLHEIKGPAVPDNLDALLDGSAPALQGESLDLDLLERILAKLNTEAALPDLGESTPPAAMPSQVSPADVPEHSHQVTIENGLDLSDLMSQQTTAELTLEGLDRARSARDDLFEHLDSIDGHLDSLNEIYGADTPEFSEQRSRIAGVKRAAGHAEWFLRAVEFINHYNQGVLPSKFLAMSVQVSDPDGQPFAVEDDCVPANVSAVVTVGSLPVTYSAEKPLEIAEGVTLPDILPSFHVDVPTGQVTFGPTEVSIDGTWIPEFTWTGIEVAIGNHDNTDSLISVAIVEPVFPLIAEPRTDSGGRVLGNQIRPEPDLYVGETGPVTVDVGVKENYFGGKTIQRFGDYELRALNPLIIEHPDRIVPGAQTELRAVIPNARSHGLDQIEWEVTASDGSPAGSFVEVFEEGDVYLLDLFETPLDEEAYPLRVTFRSVSTECLRASDQAPPRESSVSIHAGGFSISRGADCLAEGNVQEFAAEWPGDEIPDTVTGVNWSIVEGGGTLLETGAFTANYTAPAASTQVTIRAEANDDSGSVATRSFTVNCNVGTQFTFERETPFLPSPGVSDTDRFDFNFYRDGASPPFQSDWIPGVARMDFSEVVPVEGAGNRSRATGDFTGIGILYQQSEEFSFFWNFSYNTDDSANEREYSRSGSTYTVTAQIALNDNSAPSRNMRITDDGRFEFVLSGRLSMASGEDISSYSWTGSDGATASGETGVLTYPLTAGNHWVELTVTDTFGNTARQLKEFSLVEFEGSFAFTFADDRETTVTPQPAPGPDFVEATLNGPFSGSFRSSGAGVTIAQIGPDLHRFQVTFSPN